MTCRKTILFFLISILFQNSKSVNFLVYCPLFAHSHHTFLAKIADTLSEEGHNVTFLAPIIVQKYENFKYLKHTTDIIYIQPDEELKKLGEIMGSAGFSKYWTEEPSVFSMIPSIKLFQKMFHKIYENLRADLSILDSLKDRKFDAMIYEVLAFNAIAIQQYLGIKTLYPTFSVTHGMVLSKSIGEPASPATLSSALSPYGEKMNFQERLMNTVCAFIYQVFMKPPKMISYSHPYYEIDLKEAESKASFVFLNSNPYLDFPRPMLTKTVLIGGISVNTSQIREERLSDEYHNILNIRVKTVLISFGSIMLSTDMPDRYKSIIVKVIEEFPNVTFIWKYESDELDFANNLKNLHFFKWIPQTALLADSRLSAFITHAGLGSINELSYMGKPAILVPIFADQLRNAKMLVRHNGSISLEKQDLGNFEKLRVSLAKILKDNSFQENAEILARQLNNQPISPRELLIKHATFGAEFGELPSLDPYSRQMSFFSLNMIDIFLFLGVFLAILVYFLFTFLRLLLNLLLKKKAVEKSQENRKTK
ncbi:glucuronosyltransferase [Caenorhabditis elegans]|uniref:glucuronosyltransferase n=1 Tax=Caenorhabditis elegans TaxID=6239 RepID=Q52GY8_CAEEL|nr:glucuronosyltransferase [Caenorhabditis elegans]CAI91175.1 glucuronosyltransferase [Caenorhabditis elegans]|eukprot:NP_001023694.1 UDP-GlucuronosylTransferase [Caenorhabditis elegans]